MRQRLFMLAGLLLIGHPAGVGAAQQVPAADQAPLPPPPPPPPAARTPETGNGRIGQRQSRDAVARDTGIEPMARLQTRVANRVQSRLRNRIDRNYDPSANATSPFVVAGEQARRPQSPRR
jgi:hypothetical protein